MSNLTLRIQFWRAIKSETKLWQTWWDMRDICFISLGESSFNAIDIAAERLISIAIDIIKNYMDKFRKNPNCKVVFQVIKLLLHKITVQHTLLHKMTKRKQPAVLIFNISETSWRQIKILKVKPLVKRSYLSCCHQ